MKNVKVVSIHRKAEMSYQFPQIYIEINLFIALPRLPGRTAKSIEHGPCGKLEQYNRKYLRNKHSG